MNAFQHAKDICWLQVQVDNKDAEIKRLRDAVKEMRDHYEVMHDKKCMCKFCVVVRLSGLDVWKPATSLVGKDGGR